MHGKVNCRRGRTWYHRSYAAEISKLDIEMKPEWLQSLLPFVVGLVVGVAGVVMLWGSLPGEAGSPEDRIAHLEAELRSTRNEVLALQGSSSSTGRRSRQGDHTSDRLKEIVRAIREGRPVTPDDLLRASQPLLRDLAPIFDRIRVKIEKEAAESLVGELTRLYELEPGRQNQLRSWLGKQAERTAREWSELLQSDGTTIEELVRASQSKPLNRELDEFMATLLQGNDEKLEQFRKLRLTQRAERVQAEADRRLERLDQIVALDENQRDQVFGIFARASRDYVPEMEIEGVTGLVSAQARSADTAMNAVQQVLSAEQREMLNQEVQRRREAATKELATMGLSLPENWNPLEWDEF